MTARIFIHPRCLQGPAMGAMQAALEHGGFTGEDLLIGPPSPRGHCELVRLVSDADGVSTFSRLDGSTFRRETVPFQGEMA